MELFVGLGNLGDKYQNNRHNIGFMAMDRIQDAYGFSPWKAKFPGTDQRRPSWKSQSFASQALDLYEPLWAVCRESYALL